MFGRQMQRWFLGGSKQSVNKMAICQQSFRVGRHQVTTNQHQIHNYHHQGLRVQGILVFRKMFASKYLVYSKFLKDQNQLFWYDPRHQGEDFLISNRDKWFYAKNELFSKNRNFQTSYTSYESLGTTHIIWLISYHMSHMACFKVYQALHSFPTKGGFSSQRYQDTNFLF